MALVTQDNVILQRGTFAQRPDSSEYSDTNVLYFATDVGTAAAASYIIVRNTDGPTGINSWVPFCGCCPAATGIIG